MTPFNPVTPVYVAPPRRTLPGFIKMVLGFKVLGSLFTLGGALLTLTALSGQQMPHDLAEQLSTLLMLASGAALLQLIGVAGVWSFKQWGVYMLAGFLMLGLVFDLRSGLAFSAVVDLVTLLGGGLAIAARWKDFE